jgi:CTP-dependent riboflavin kinase
LERNSVFIEISISSIFPEKMITEARWIIAGRGVYIRMDYTQSFKEHLGWKPYSKGTTTRCAGLA